MEERGWGERYHTGFFNAVVASVYISSRMNGLWPNDVSCACSSAATLGRITATGKGDDMSDDSRLGIDVESALQDYYDFEKFFGDAVEEMDEDELDMLSAATGYAAFLDRMGLSDDSTDL